LCAQRTAFQKIVKNQEGQSKTNLQQRGESEEQPAGSAQGIELEGWKKKKKIENTNPEKAQNSELRIPHGRRSCRLNGSAKGD